MLVSSSAWVWLSSRLPLLQHTGPGLQALHCCSRPTTCSCASAGLLGVGGAAPCCCGTCGWCPSVACGACSCGACVWAPRFCHAGVEPAGGFSCGLYGHAACGLPACSWKGEGGAGPGEMALLAPEKPEESSRLRPQVREARDDSVSMSCLLLAGPEWPWHSQLCRGALRCLCGCCWGSTGAVPCAISVAGVCAYQLACVTGPASAKPRPLSFLISCDCCS